MNICVPVLRTIRTKGSLKHSHSSYKKWLNLRTCSSLSSEQSNKGKDEISIPTRIPRGPTDILDAISSTIGRDPTSPHYKYHDDPYLTPLSNQNKRNFALAQESGRKTAHWLRQEHSEYFIYTTWDPPMKMKTLYKNAEPFIDAYSPCPVYNENSEVTEDDLKLVMKSSLVNDAKTIYGLLESKNITISEESQQQLLELFCYFNEDEPLPEDWCEERWHRNIGRRNKAVMWKEGGLAQSLFDKMENKTPEAYCALLQGMCKYYQAEKAYNLYKECLENNIPLNTGVYNGLLKVVGFLKESIEMRWELITELLKDMNEKGLKPDLDTLNSALESLSNVATMFTKQKALQLYFELVNKCKIEPSLATWCHMLSIFSKERGPKCDILYSIMDTLKGKKLEIRDPDDTLFFVTAMSICRHQLHDVKLADRINELLLHESNYNLIGDSYKESVYYRNYFVLVCRYQPLDVFMDLYTKLVPHIYCPEPSVMEEVIKTLDTNGAIEYFPLIWSHIVMFGQTNRLSILQMILDSMVNHLPSQSQTSEVTMQGKTKTIDDVKTLNEAIALEMNSIQLHYSGAVESTTIETSLAIIAWDLWKKVEEQPEQSTNKLSWTGPMLSNIIQVLTRAGRIDDAYVVLQKLQKGTNVTGVPTFPDQIMEFSGLAMKEKKPSYVVSAANYLSDNGFVESSSLAKEALQVFLNKTAQDVEEIVSDVLSDKTKANSENPHISSLLLLATQIARPVAVANATLSKSEAADSSTSSSSSDESSDDEGNKKK